MSLNGNGSPTVLFAAVPGNRPVLGDTAAGGPEGVSAIDAIPAEVAGLALSGNVNAIEWTTTAAFAGSGTLDVHDNVVTGAGGIGVDVNLAGTGATRLSFHDNQLTATGTALNVQETGAGTLTITAFDDNVVSGDTGGYGLVVANAIFDAAPGGGFDLVAGGTSAVGAPGNGVGLGGVVMSGVSGDLLFTDLDVFASNGSGIQVAGTGASNLGGGTGMRFRVGAGVGVVSATGGPAVEPVEPDRGRPARDPDELQHHVARRAPGRRLGRRRHQRDLLRRLGQRDHDGRRGDRAGLPGQRRQRQDRLRGHDHQQLDRGARGVDHELGRRRRRETTWCSPGRSTRTAPASW